MKSRTPAPCPRAQSRSEPGPHASPALAPRCRRARAAARSATVAAGALLLALALSADEAAWAAEDPATGTEELVAVVNRIRTVIVSLAAALATLLLTIGGLRWLLAGGDPGEIDKARRALMGAAIGYGIAILATVLMTILDYIVGGQ